MLVLERYEKQGIRIDDDALFTVLEIKPASGGRPASVRIGIVAPQSKRIMREEAWNQELAEKADAAD